MREYRHDGVPDSQLSRVDLFHPLENLIAKDEELTLQLMLCKLTSCLYDLCELT